MKKASKSIKSLAVLLSVALFSGSVGFVAKPGVTSDKYVQCMGSPDVQFVGQLEMAQQLGGMTDAQIEQAIEQSNSPENKQKAKSAYEFYKKNRSAKNGPVIEAFAACLNK